MIICPQDPLPCSYRNSCPLLGWYRRHSSLISFLLRKRTHIQFQIEGTWDPKLALLAGGKNSLPYPLFPLLSLTSFLDLPELLPSK